VTLWNHRRDTDGLGNFSERALQQRADDVVAIALEAVDRAFSMENPINQLRAALLLEVARAMRTEARGGSWTELPGETRRQLRNALLVMEHLAGSGAPLPVA
jgi:hypothetical protein